MCSVLEVNVGIKCACSLALPAFLDRYWPHFSIGSVFSKLYAYFSTPSRRKANKNASGTGSSNKKRAPSSSSSEQLHGAHPNQEGWVPFDERPRAERKLRPDRDTIVAHHTTIGLENREEDLEEWGCEGILKKVGLTQSYPMDKQRSQL